ncbi:MAG: hypothetical protein CL923_04710 [Deltaproteobacteria bacterium]|nr:hypothetical protein [Deltaproteobacteria bacterium]
MRGKSLQPAPAPAFSPISGHSIPNNTIECCWQASQVFFALLEAEKLEVRMPSAGYPSGFAPMEAETSPANPRRTNTIVPLDNFPSNPTNPTNPFTPGAAQRLEQFAKHPVFLTLLFVGSKPEQQSKLLKTADQKKLKAGLRLLHPRRLQGVLRSLESLRDCRRIARILKTSGQFKSVITANFLNSLVEARLPFERFWHLHGKRYRSLPKVKPSIKNADHLLTGSSQRDLALKSLLKRYAEVDWMGWHASYDATPSQRKKIYTFECFEEAALWVEPWRLKRLARGGPVHQALLLAAVREMRKWDYKRWVNHYAPGFIDASPNWLPRHCLQELKQEEWHLLASSSHFWKQAANPGQLLQTKERLPWQHRLPYALSNPEKGLRLEQELSQSARLEGLEFVRNHYPPNIAAAMELALHFGLRYGSFLASVAKPLKLGRDDSVFGNECDGLYRTYHIPKQSGGTRLITAPSTTLKHFQRTLLDQVMNGWDLHETAMGFRQGCGVVDNALPHIGKRLVVNVDLKGFFPNTKFPLILKVLHHRFFGILSPRSTKTKNWDVHLDPDKLPNSLRSPADENPTKLERLRMQEGLRRELIRELKNSEEGSRNQGWLSGLFEQELQQAATTRIPWQSVLMRFVSAIRRSDYRSFPFNKRHLWRGIGLPSIGIPGPDHLVVAVDTSASMNNDLLSQILAEIDRIRAFSECRMTLIECDAAIHRVTEWEAWDDSSAALQQWCFQGRGGTCFRPVFSWIKKQQRSGALNADALIYLTDGYGQFPDDCTLPVLWGVPEDGLGKDAFPFGEVLTIQEV